ncbi:hypothetical protein [Telluribacter humicola]|uniref:hypothetical protein n=1 Tax=Telluribacter humicola TaxID=1720261 RepID=UPI001A96B423|nr:hypothetical protein [Telluribacter humicola]
MNTTTATARTDWYPEQKLIVTQLSGDVDQADIEQWEQSLHQALAQVEDGGTFKILVNLWGFKAVDFPTHKKYREIIPLTLANYGWKVGYVDLFEEAAAMTFTTERGIRCTGAAHAHQDATKIEKYESLFGRDNERFFTDPKLAEEWILGL